MVLCRRVDSKRPTFGILLENGTGGFASFMITQTRYHLYRSDIVIFSLGVWSIPNHGSFEIQPASNREALVSW